MATLLSLLRVEELNKSGGHIPQIIDFLDETGRQLQQLTSGISILCCIMRAQRILEGNLGGQQQGLLCSRTR